MFLLLFLCFLGCNKGSSWNSVEDCRTLSPSSDRDDCLSEHAVSLFVQDPKKAEKELISMVKDPIILDYIWLKVTREYNPASQKYCFKIKDKALRDRCATLVRRPHLYREK